MRTPLRFVFAAPLALAISACSKDPLPGQAEERPTAEADVPVEVRLAAARICARLGKVTTGAWAWDTEDRVWEVALLGLPRQAELDLFPDGRFEELELVHGFEELARLLPDVAESVRARCGDRGVLIELSLRRLELLDPLVELPAAWKLDGVVLEFQGPGRGDHELDARGMMVTHPVDDHDGR